MIISKIVNDEIVLCDFKIKWEYYKLKIVNVPQDFNYYTMFELKKYVLGLSLSDLSNE